MSRTPVSAVILAGGLGTRIGGDKALQLLHGRPLIDWVLDAVTPQSDEVLVNANNHSEIFSTRGYRVIADLIPDWAGPLAGVQAALHVARCDWVVSVPCDTPFLPDDFIARLYAAIGTCDAAVAVVEGRRQPTVALYRKDVLPRLNAYLDAGERRVGGWLDTLCVSEVAFNDPAAFVNINSLEDLAQASQSTLLEIQP